MTQHQPSKVRCAIYTRKSTERGLDLNVTSLQAQRDICQSYIKCQAHRGWTELPECYDDGGFSGGSLERPALQRLIGHVEHGRIDVIVIYKIDRLTRSLLDFVRLIEVLERCDVSFVSVTQAFDTSDSMGRLILNILLTFAQFERELMSDRVRDKKAAMQRKGFFAGGLPPFGYLVDSGGRLCLDDERAPLVRDIFKSYIEGQSVKEIVRGLRFRNCFTRQYTSKAGRTRGGQPITSAIINHVLENPIYTGNIVHRGEWIGAEIDPLVTRLTWDAAQAERRKRSPKLDHDRNFLIHLLYDHLGRRMKIMDGGPGRTNQFRYYRSEAAGWSRGTEHKAVLVRAEEVELVVKSSLLSLFRDREKLRTAVMSDGEYSKRIADDIRRGATAARRIDRMDAKHFRRALLALVPRIDVLTSEVRLYVGCRDLKRFLAWDGKGFFSSDRSSAAPAQNVYPLSCAAALIRGHHRDSLPIARSTNANAAPSEPLLRLIRDAGRFRQAVFDQRDKSLAELASERKISQSHFVRVLRVNYLAPDILTAMVDGTQPSNIQRADVLRAAMLLDWDQQREALGFH
jgi:site-specific DNA recombinase